MSKNFELLKQAGADSLTASISAPSAPAVIWPAPKNPAPKNEGSPSDWFRIFHIWRRHWRSASAFSGIVIATATIVTLMMKPVYEPTARIEVDPPGEVFSLNGSQGASGAEYLETQAKNLKSDKLAIAVVRKLHLDHVPDIVGPMKGEANPSVQPSNDTQLTDLENAAVGTFHNRFKVIRDTSSRLITVSFWSHDPSLAAAVTNTALETFIDQTYQEQHSAIMQSSEWLSRQLDDIRTRMETSNRVLANFQKSIGVADVDANRSTFTDQLSELNRQMSQAQADRLQLEALLNQVHGTNADNLPDVRNNPVVQQLNGQLGAARAELAQTEVVYGKNHPATKKLQSQIEALQGELTLQKSAILASLRTQYTAATTRERLFESQLKGTTGELNQMAQYNALKKEAGANEDLYNKLYGMIKEAGIAAASKSSNLKIVDEARVLDSPTRPNRGLNICVGIFIGMLGGLGLAFVMDHADTRIFTPEDVRGWIGASNVSILPLFFSNKAMPGESSRHNNGNGATRYLAPGVRFLLDQPQSPEAEAMRALYTSIMLSRNGASPQVVMVVSSFPGEGKTTVALNLALAMAQHGSACVVDADLRRGRAAAAFGVRSDVGLSDVLAGSVPLESAMVEVPGVPNLTVIPAHLGSPHAGQLVCSDRMREVITELRSRFRLVVVDSAPLLPFADGRAISSMVDGLIFVGRCGVTTREIANRSLEILQSVRSAPVLEFVLNGADLSSADYRYYDYGYNYYYGQPVQ